MMRLLRALSTVAVALVVSGSALAAPPLQDTKKEDKKATEQSRQETRQQPSLVELAARAKRDRSSEGASTVPVFDNASLKRSGSGRVGRTQLPPPPPVDENAEESQADETPSEDEQLKAVQQEIAEAKIQYVTAVNGSQVIQLSLNALRNRYLQTSDAAAQQKYRADMANKLADLAENDAKISQLGQDLDGLRKKAAGLGMSRDEIDELIGELPKPLKIPGLEPDSE